MPSPPPESAQLRGVPLFPLPDLVVYPGFAQPLHIFEPRYRQMVGDVLDTGGHIVVGTVLGEDRNEIAGAPSVQEVGGLGAVEEYEKLEDGRYNLLLRGVARVRLSEVGSDRLYRKVDVEVLEDPDDSSASEEKGYRQRILSAIRERAGSGLELLEELSLSQLADLLLLQLQLSPRVNYEIYARASSRERVQAALSTHEGRAGDA